MQQTYMPLPRGSKFSATRAALQDATACFARGGLPVLCVALLCGCMFSFAAYMLSAVLTEIVAELFALPLLVALSFYYVLLLVISAMLAVPLLMGRIRAAGLVAQGEIPAMSELLHYFTSPRLFLRAIGMGFLWLLTLLCPMSLAAVPLAAGNESMPLYRAYALSWRLAVKHVGDVFLMLWSVLWRFLLSLATLGVLWLFYFAHHAAVSCFVLTMKMMNDPEGERI